MKTLLIVLLFAVPVMGQELPDKPVGREFKVEAVALGASLAVDTISTKVAFNRCQFCFESGGVSNGTREIAKPAVVWGLVDVASVVVAYELKKHVRGPWWRIPMMIRIGEHMNGAAGNFRR